MQLHLSIVTNHTIRTFAISFIVLGNIPRSSCFVKECRCITGRKTLYLPVSIRVDTSLIFLNQHLPLVNSLYFAIFTIDWNLLQPLTQRCVELMISCACRVLHQFKSRAAQEHISRPLEISLQKAQLQIPLKWSSSLQISRLLISVSNSSHFATAFLLFSCSMQKRFW